MNVCSFQVSISLIVKIPRCPYASDVAWIASDLPRDVNAHNATPNDQIIVVICFFGLISIVYVYPQDLQ